MFEESTFNQPLLWNTIRVKNMYGMFYKNYYFNQSLPWDTRSLEYAGYMFADAQRFNHSVNHWNFSSIKDMTSMFHGALNYDQDHFIF